MQNKFWIYGKHSVKAALNNNKRNIIRLFSTKPLDDQIIKLTQKRHISSKIVAQEILDKLSNNNNHQGIMIEVTGLQSPSLEEIIKKISKQKLQRIIILDHVLDTQNIGAILRSAHAFNASCIILHKHNSPNESGAIARAASGSLEAIPIIKVPNIVVTIKMLQKHEFWVIGLDKNGHSIHNEAGSNKMAMVFGSEQKSIRNLVAKSCDQIVSIPISNIDSLNVGHAVSITLYKFSIN